MPIAVQIFIAACTTLAQSPSFKHYTTKNGLPSNTIYEIKQDQKGYIWIATNNGVSRYNGNEFDNSFVFKDKSFNPDISNIFEDHNGKVWFINMNCELSYFENDTIHPYKYNKVLKQSLDSYPFTFKNCAP